MKGNNKHDLKSLSKEVDSNGYFNCGEQSGPESIQIKELPSNLHCENCKLEFTWQDANGTHTSFSDVKIESKVDASIVLRVMVEYKPKGSAISFLIILAAGVGGGYLIYKVMTPGATPKTEEKKETPEEDKGLLSKPEDEIVTEHATLKPPKRGEEELKTPVKGQALPSPREGTGSFVDTPDLKAMENIFIDSIQKIIVSDQINEAQDFRELKKSGKFSWKKTHFVFVIDCSGSMKGIRWESVTFGLKVCLNRLRTMDEIRVSGFTFDKSVHDFCREVTPREALKLSQDILFSAKGTDYIAALEHAMTIINEAEHKDYLTCIMFLSDGLGGLPEDTIEKLNAMKKEGHKILFYTIGCATDEDDDMIIMSTKLKGEHYKVTNSEASKIVFTKILEV